MNNFFCGNGKAFVQNVLIIAFIIFGAELSLAETKLQPGKSFFARHYAGISLRDVGKAWSLISDFNGLTKLHPVPTNQLTSTSANILLLIGFPSSTYLLPSALGYSVERDWRVKRHPWAWMHSLSQVRWRRLGSRGTGELQCGRFYFLIHHHGRQRALLQLPIHRHN